MTPKFKGEVGESFETWKLKSRFPIFKNHFLDIKEPRKT